MTRVMRLLVQLAQVVAKLGSVRELVSLTENFYIPRGRPFLYVTFPSVNFANLENLRRVICVAIKVVTRCGVVALLFLRKNTKGLHRC